MSGRDRSRRMWFGPTLIALASCSRRVPEPTASEAAVRAFPTDESSSPPVPVDLLSLAAPDAAAVDRHTEFALGPLAPGAPFEGTVGVRVATIESDTTEYATYHFVLKGRKVRWDLFSEGGKGDPTGYRMYDGEARKFYTVMHQPVLYTTDEAALSPDAGTPKSWRLSPFKLEPKGMVENVACSNMRTHDEEFEYDACLASGIPTLPMPLLGPGVARAVPFGPELQKKGLFPLHVVVRRSKAPPGVTIRPVVATLTVFKIERGQVPDRAFELPRYPVTETPTLIPPRLLR